MPIDKKAVAAKCVIGVFVWHPVSDMCLRDAIENSFHAARWTISLLAVDRDVIETSH